MEPFSASYAMEEDLRKASPREQYEAYGLEYPGQVVSLVKPHCGICDKIGHWEHDERLCPIKYEER